MGSMRSNHHMPAPKPPRGWTTVGILGVLVGLAFWAGVIFVGWHFISKYW